MKTLQERLIYVRNKAGKTQGEVAEFIGITQPSYSELEGGQTKMSKYTAQIAYFLKVNAYWLATGKGDMTPEVPSDLALKTMKLSKSQQNAVSVMVDSLLDKSDQ